MRPLSTPFRATSTIRCAAALCAAASLSLVLVACSGTDSTTTSSATAAASASTTGSASTAASGTASAESSRAASDPAGTGAPTAPSSQAGTPAPLTQAEATETPSADAGWVTGTTEGGTAAEAGVETALRTGSHDGYDRVVVETAGSGTLAWHAEVTDTAATLGKGDLITLSGAHLIDVLVSGTSMPTTEEQAQTSLTYGLHTVNGPAVKQVWLDGTFEDQFQLVIGTDASEYRITTLSNPTRIVIDVRTGS